MSLDKSIQHGKEHRKPYYGAKAFDPSCRNHGDDDWSKNNRLIQRKREDEAARAKVKENQNEQRMTNREWLESLSDEELAEMILGAFQIFLMIDRNMGTRENDSRTDSIRRHIKWLRAEHKK